MVVVGGRRVGVVAAAAAAAVVVLAPVLPPYSPPNLVLSGRGKGSTWKGWHAQKWH